MTDLIDVVQKQEPGSELVELFEITLPNGTILYLHPGFDTTNATGDISFREKTAPYDPQDYEAFPIEMSGVEFVADGAQNRPTLAVANVTSAFSDQLGSNISNDDLIGQPVTKRTTLKKYLVGESHDTGTSGPPIEFPTQKYIIDRITAESSLSLTFELASPFDLSGIKLPNRNILGRYCSWEYQGNDLNSRGGCLWSKDSLVVRGISGSQNVCASYKAYFTSEDIPIVPEIIFTTNTAWATSTSYAVGALVLESAKVYMANTAHTSGATFAGDSANWDVIADTAWATSTSYAENDYVKNGSNYYRCNTTHTSDAASFSADSAKWDTIYLYKTWDTVTPSNNVFAVDDYVEYDNGTQTTVWRALKASENVNPEESTYWTRGDMCGKKFSSCKCRFQYNPRHNKTELNASPSTRKLTNEFLPFGAFLGSRKFR